jgi:hypothetical protein
MIIPVPTYEQVLIFKYQIIETFVYKYKDNDILLEWIDDLKKIYIQY